MNLNPYAPTVGDEAERVSSVQRAAGLLLKRFSILYGSSSILGIFTSDALAYGFWTAVQDWAELDGLIVLPIFVSISCVASLAYSHRAWPQRRALRRCVGGFVFGMVLLPVEKLSIALMQSVPAINIRGQIHHFIAIVLISVVISVTTEWLITMLASRRISMGG